MGTMSTVSCQCNIKLLLRLRFWCFLLTLGWNSAQMRRQLPMLFRMRRHVARILIQGTLILRLHELLRRLSPDFLLFVPCGPAAFLKLVSRYSARNGMIHGIVAMIRCIRISEAAHLVARGCCAHMVFLLVLYTLCSFARRKRQCTVMHCTRCTSK